MIKKISIIALALLMSFGLLEGLSIFKEDKIVIDIPCSKSLKEQNQCPYEYRPFKNISYDFISDDISFDINHLQELNNADLHLEEGAVVVKPEVVIIKEESIKKPKIAIVIDDMGISKKRSEDIISLNAPITLAFLTYAKNLDKYFYALRDSKFEVMAHIPMEAKTKFDEAPDTLRTSFSDEKIKKELTAMLKKFDDIKFINNHTGSKFSENKKKMSAVMSVLREHGISFLDSKTSSKTVGKKTAEKYGVKYLSRNVFLDNENDFDYIMGQIKQAENIAKKYGSAIAIGHPKSETYKALKHWLKNQKDFDVVTLSNL